jgi:DeoR/GlpR family transcriptional regulator of sugar metabolism
MRVARAVIDKRRADMAEWVKQRRFLSIQDVCQRFEISEPTARRDLRALAQEDKITRTFGGAIGDFDITFESFSHRTEIAHQAKKALTREASSRVRSGMTLFLDGGSTLFYLARELGRRELDGLTVVTNNVAAAEALVQTEGINTVLSGGEFIGRQSVLVGPVAIRGLKPFRFDFAFLSAVGINEEGIWNTRGRVIEIQKSVIRQARESIFLLDRTKFGRGGDEFLLPVNKIPHLITDARTTDFKKARVEFIPDSMTLVTVT